MRRMSAIAPVVALALAALHPRAASAQAAASTAVPVPAAAAEPAPAAGPTWDALQVGWRPAAAPASREVTASVRRAGRREGRALAIVGGAALIAGAIIGDDAGTVIMISGAVIGLYGLWLWQR